MNSERYTYSYDAWGCPLTVPQAGYVATTTDTTQVSYSGNHLTDGSNYAYDANGNLTKDLGRGIAQISYNLLNLPSSVAPGLGGGPHGVIYGADSRDYLYTASGVKLQSKAMLPLNLPGMPDVRERTDYVGNLIYDRTSLQKVLFDGGYVDMSGDSPEYRFFVTDHLGNNRLVADAAGTILQTNHYDPYGESLPEGSAVDSGNPYKYGGKEYNDKALAYDFGARHYTSSIPRWTTMDPLCEKYYSLSPYAYCAGNPMNLVDPEGLWITIYYGGVSYRYEDEHLYKYEDADYKEVNPDEGSFLEIILNALNTIKSIEGPGKELIDFFANDDNSAYIHAWEGDNIISTDLSSNPIYLNEKGRGNISPLETEVSEPLFWVDVSHELAHRLQYLTEDPSEINSVWYEDPEGKKIIRGEQFATYYENRIREASGLPLRTHYAFQEDGLPSEHTRIIDSRGRSLFYNYDYITLKERKRARKGSRNH